MQKALRTYHTAPLLIHLAEHLPPSISAVCRAYHDGRPDIGLNRDTFAALQDGDASAHAIVGDVLTRFMLGEKDIAALSRLGVRATASAVVTSTQRTAPAEPPEAAVSPFDFEGHEVRVRSADGQDWFVGKDVCDALGHSNSRRELRKLDDDERAIVDVPTAGGLQTMVVINEPGVYRLIFTSRTDSAQRFKRWLAHEVLPALRKRGTYTVPPAQATPAQPPAVPDHMMQVLETYARASEEALRRAEEMGHRVEELAVERALAKANEEASTQARRKQWREAKALQRRRARDDKERREMAHRLQRDIDRRKAEAADAACGIFAALCGR
jgi:prophage antirepressor-like protein